MRRGRSELSEGRPSLGPMTAILHTEPAPTRASPRSRLPTRPRPAVPRCRRAGRPTSRPARCCTASARSTGCPSARASPPSAARWCTRCSRSSTTSRRPGARSRPRRSLIEPAWAELRDEPGVAELFEVAQDDGAETDANAPESVEAWLASAGKLVEKYFALEDPTRIEPDGREQLVEVTLPDGLLLRGFVDRVDVAPNGALRVVDYKTGSMPREAFEAKALFQMKFYALVLWRTRGVVAAQLKLIYLGDGDTLTYAPDEAELRPLRAHAAGHLGRDRARGGHRRLPAQQDPALRLVRPPGGLPGLRRHSPAVPGRGRRAAGWQTLLPVVERD